MVRLLIIDHLDSVFSRSQNTIRMQQHILISLGHETMISESRNGIYRSHRPQFNMPTAQNQLLDLRVKLNFPDAANPQLDMMAVYIERCPDILSCLNLTFNRQNVLNGSVIHILAPNKRRQNSIDKLFTTFNISRTWPGFDHGGSFPVLT